MANNVYNSSTLGPLPLSQKGKDLMQTLRHAQQNLVRDAPLYVTRHLNWDEVSRARGELVRYIGELEKGLEGTMTELALLQGQVKMQENILENYRETARYAQPLKPVTINGALGSYSIGALIGELNKRFHP